MLPLADLGQLIYLCLAELLHGLGKLSTDTAANLVNEAPTCQESKVRSVFHTQEDLNATDYCQTFPQVKHPGVLSIQGSPHVESF